MAKKDDFVPTDTSGVNNFGEKHLKRAMRLGKDIRKLVRQAQARGYSMDEVLQALCYNTATILAAAYGNDPMKIRQQLAVENSVTVEFARVMLPEINAYRRAQILGEPLPEVD